MFSLILYLGIYDYFDPFEEQAPMPGAEQQNVFFSYIE